MINAAKVRQANAKAAPSFWARKRAFSVMWKSPFATQQAAPFHIPNRLGNALLANLSMST
jgi:hypothetical protein